MKSDDFALALHSLSEVAAKEGDLNQHIESFDNFKKKSSSSAKLYTMH